MQYRVPQFIEHEAKILGPLNLKQSLIVGAAIAACFFLYFAIGQQNFFFFLMVAALITGLALAISFTKIEGLSLPSVMKNFFNFNTNPRVYLWKRKESTVFLSTKREKKNIVANPEEKKSPLKMTNQGKIDQLIKKIDFGKK